jgi:hypothetical protein
MARCSKLTVVEKYLALLYVKLTDTGSLLAELNRGKEMNVIQGTIISALFISSASMAAEDCSNYPRGVGADFQPVEGSITPRIISTGRATPFSEDRDDVFDAYDEAYDEALRYITDYMELAVSSSRDREKITDKLTEQSGNNREASKVQVETLVKTWSTSSAALLRGVVVLGDCHTPGELTLVTVGIKPETIAGAEGLATSMANSLSNSPTVRSRSDMSSNAGDVKSSSTNNAEENKSEVDNLRRVQGSSNTDRLKDF